MNNPFFYEAALPIAPGLYTLSDASSKHASLVLRMKLGDEMMLTNGLGLSSLAKIVSTDKKKTVVQLLHPQQMSVAKPQHAIAISFVKNAARMEWFLEKATELGITAFYPLIADRTERTHFKKDRWEQIIVSAMLQSQQVYKPVLHDPIELDTLLQNNQSMALYMAHCEPGDKTPLSACQMNQSAMVLIGPEGDFTPSEIELAAKAGATMVSLGNTRLRTETAGMAAAVVLQFQSSLYNL